MATSKISITVDAKRLEELKRLAGAGASLSAIVDEALRIELHRYRMAALLEEMEKEKPITPEERVAGEKLWQEIESSSTRVRSRRSRGETASLDTRSKRR